MSTPRAMVREVPVAGPLTLDPEEAHHLLRVRRVEPGASVELLDGRGGVGVATLTSVGKRGRDLVALVTIQRLERRPPPVPRLRVTCPAPKGDRLERMIDQLSQVGVWAWRPLDAQRAVADPREGKLARLNRVAVEAAKQCGRAWTLRIEPGVDLPGVLDGPPARVVVADASGDAYGPAVPPAPAGDAPPDAPHVDLLLGPEGGWSPAEFSLFRARGVPVVALPTPVMRLETAAVAVAAVIIDREARLTPPAPAAPDPAG